MGPSERQKKILRAIVEDYVRTAEPVSSKAISQLPELNYSSATIRNEMAALTDLGLLEQPHTSAGRVPSALGYRLYVNELMQDYRLSTDETKSLNQAMEMKMAQADKVISQIGKLVSQLTDLPAYAVRSHVQQLSVKRFDFIGAGTQSIILVVMLSSDEIKNKLIRLPLVITDHDLKLLGAVLNASLAGIPASGFTPELIDRITKNAGDAASLVPIVVDFVADLLQAQQHSEVFLTGQNRLLSQPEFHDIDKAQQMLTTLDEDIISNLPATIGGNGTQILVGPEDISKELRDTSVVMTQFDIGEGMKGMIGVVGPTRMDYAKVTARLSYFAEGLAKMFGTSELPPSETDKEDS
ncbi:MAG: heat-inducible transcriptional repressor HrcA [Oscillospiraceae bacterium]|nr:heat-inducible transcriptional repressor HrcA [Oscillospiraceae bacterium]